MENKQFNLECNQIMAARNLETNSIINTILNKEGKSLEKGDAQKAVLAHILPELLAYGIVERTTTAEIAEACNCKSTVVNNVLGFVGFKYERDRVTHKQTESKGLFERYYQHEYTDDTCNKMKKTSSVFNIVATEKLFDLYRELGLTVEVDSDKLAKLHKDSLEKAYTKKTTREYITVTITKNSVVFKNLAGTTETVNYEGAEEAIHAIQSLQDTTSFQPKATEMEIETEEDVETLLQANADLEDDGSLDDLSFLDELMADDNIEELEWIELEDEEETEEPQPQVEEAPVEEYIQPKALLLPAPVAHVSRKIQPEMPQYDVIELPTATSLETSNVQEEVLPEAPVVKKSYDDEEEFGTKRNREYKSAPVFDEYEEDDCEDIQDDEFMDFFDEDEEMEWEIEESTPSVSKPSSFEAVINGEPTTVFIDRNGFYTGYYIFVDGEEVSISKYDIENYDEVSEYL